MWENEWERYKVNLISPQWQKILYKTLSIDRFHGAMFMLRTPLLLVKLRHKKINGGPVATAVNRFPCTCTSVLFAGEGPK